LSDKKAIVLLSGGLDSSTCLGVAVKEHGSESVHAVTVTYGQRHSKETSCAEKVADHYGVPLHTIDLTEIFAGANCSLLSDSQEDVPDGTYYEQIHDKGVSTYVPFRNGLMVAAIASKALSIDSDAIWTVYLGVHSDDTAGDAYPDCSEEFVSAIDKAVGIGTYGQVSVTAPFVGLHKSDIVKVGLEIGVPYELTWSCYKGGEKQCGTCATCLDRKRAFEVNGAVDPVPYKV
jgi:7-cyano-7-deazaguanine synthase